MRFGCLLVVGLGFVWGVLVVLPGFCWLNCVVVGYVTFCVCGFTICVVLLCGGLLILCLNCLVCLLVVVCEFGGFLIAGYYVLHVDLAVLV